MPLAGLLVLSACGSTPTTPATGGGASVLPLLAVGGSQSQGFEAGRYNSMLDAAGFTPPAVKK